VVVVANEVVETSDTVLKKGTLAALGRDLERRNGDEKRRCLLDSSGLSVVRDLLMVAAGVIVAAVDSSSLEASRECAESYITHQSALRPKATCRVTETRG
jgi:hypothetical protein